MSEERCASCACLVYRKGIAYPEDYAQDHPDGRVLCVATEQLHAAVNSGALKLAPLEFETTCGFPLRVPVYDRSGLLNGVIVQKGQGS